MRQTTQTLLLLMTLNYDARVRRKQQTEIDEEIDEYDVTVSSKLRIIRREQSSSYRR